MNIQYIGSSKCAHDLIIELGYGSTLTIRGSNLIVTCQRKRLVYVSQLQYERPLSVLFELTLYDLRKGLTLL